MTLTTALHQCWRAAARAKFIGALLLALAGLLTLGAGYQEDPPPATPTPAPTQPPIIIVVPPSPFSGGGGGGGSSTVDNNEPVLAITDYRTNPSPIISGQAFEATITVKNTGGKAADGVVASVKSDENFVGLGAPAQLGRLEPNASASFTLQVHPARLNSGAQSLSVDFTYHTENGGEANTVRTAGVTVAGGSGAPPGRPQIVVEDVQVESEPRAIGDTFEISVILRNVGRRKAYSVSASLSPSEHTTPARGSGSSQLGDLNAGEAVTLTLSLVLDKPSATGRLAETFELEYRDSANRELTSEETASFDTGASSQQKPQLIIASHRTEPERPAPGEAFTLTLEIENVGTGSARQVLVRLGNEEGLKPFLPLGAGSVGFAGEIEPGGKATFEQALLMEGSAAGGAYPVNVALGYESALGETYTETALVGLLTLTRPQVKIDLTKPLPESVSVGQAFDIPLEVINIGRQRLDVSTVEVLSEQLELTRNSLYVGPLDASISSGLTAKAVAKTEGLATVRVLVYYRDDLNQTQVIEHTFTVEVGPAASTLPDPTAADQAAAQTASAGWWQTLRHFFGLGG